MRCETCHGTGRLNGAARYEPRLGLIPIPCPCEDCGGTGFSHCCEGDRACPEPDDGGNSQSGSAA